MYALPGPSAKLANWLFFGSTGAPVPQKKDRLQTRQFSRPLSAESDGSCPAGFAPASGLKQACGPFSSPGESIAESLMDCGNLLIGKPANGQICRGTGAAADTRLSVEFASRSRPPLIAAAAPARSPLAGVPHPSPARGRLRSTGNIGSRRGSRRSPSGTRNDTDYSPIPTSPTCSAWRPIPANVLPPSGIVQCRSRCRGHAVSQLATRSTSRSRCSGLPEPRPSQQLDFNRLRTLGELENPPAGPIHGVRNHPVPRRTLCAVALPAGRSSRPPSAR